MTPRISQVIMQPTSRCNLNCHYCYVPNRRDSSRMDDETLDAAISKVLQSDFVQGTVEFVWHAGEPLMAGLQFYERSIELSEKYNTRNIRVVNSIQTNGTLINARWCEFFSRNRFFIGLSIDGPEFLHDRNRVNWAGAGSHRAAMQGFARLKDQGILPAVICVLTRESLCYPDEIFSFFLENGFDYIAFNVEEVENSNAVSSFSIAGSLDRTVIVEEYRNFMSRMYELWRPHAPTITIREFRDMFSAFRGLLRDNGYRRQSVETDDLGIVTIQKNGDITTFSPEFAGAKSAEYENFVVGNIRHDSIETILGHPMFVLMRENLREGIRRCEESCMWFALCGGAFTSNKYFENGSLASTETTTCLLHRQTLASVLLERLADK